MSDCTDKVEPFADAAEAEVAGLPMLPRPLLDSNLNEDDRLLTKDKDKFRMNPFSYIKKKKRTAPAPPKRSSSFGKMDGHLDRRGLGPDCREDFNNGASTNDALHGIDPSRLVGSNSTTVVGVTNGAPAYPGQLFPSHSRKKGTGTTSGNGGKLATTPPSEEDPMSNSKRFLRSSSASSMPPGSERTEWKSVTLPRDIQSSHFDSGTIGGKPALPRKKADCVPRGGTLTPPPRLPKKTEDPSDEVFKDSESSPGSSPLTLTPKLGRRPQTESSKTGALQAELFKPNVFPPLGPAGDECRPRRLKHTSEVPGQRDREKGKFAKPKPAPPPPPVSSAKSGKTSRSPTFDVSSDAKVKGSSEMNPPSPSSTEQGRGSLSQESAKKLPKNTSKVQPPKTSSTSPTGQLPGMGTAVGDSGSNFIPLITTRRSLRKTRQPSERLSNSCITREMVLESTELLRAAIGRISEQTGSHSAVLEAGKNLSKYCVSYVESIQQMRNKFAFREAINKLENSLRELQICPAATGGANTPQDFSKLLSSVKEISDIVQR